MRINTKRASLMTHEGARVSRISVIAQLRRSVLSCLLWESEFYEDGADIAKRISDLTAQCVPEDVAALAIEAREQMHLRHVPLLLLRELARHPLMKDRPQLLSKTMGRVLQRADEPAEFLALYWKDGKQPLSKQVKRGLAWSMRRFSEYDLAKYNRDAEVTPRDVLFMSHAKPKDEAQASLWKKLAANDLATPDTWEVQLSAGADKKETFERLIREKKLGYFALIRNLRNMEQVGVDAQLVREAILARKGGAEKILPFRYIAAARYAKQFEPELDTAMQAAFEELPKLIGTTIVRWIVPFDRGAPAHGSLTQPDRDPPFKRSDPGAIPGRPTNFARHAQVAVRPSCQRERRSATPQSGSTAFHQSGCPLGGDRSPKPVSRVRFLDGPPDHSGVGCWHPSCALNAAHAGPIPAA